MDDWRLHDFGKALYLCEKLGPLIDDIMVPTQGQKAGGGSGSHRGSSRPPLRVPILDLKMETEHLLAFWARILARETGQGLVLCPQRIAGIAAWMQARLHVLADAPAATVAAEEIIAQAQLLDSIFADDTPVEGSCREIAAACRQCGHDLSKSTIYRWVHDGLIPSTVRDGVVIVALSDVMNRLQ
ncbi:hypothetical protein HO111_10515 [Corynebacterium ulcerans]|uniref:helix-turn-helix transcriptional regulator n=1 Tax=Corynebacterium silvaticum TaxID=2320431 RepID=UPI00148EF3E3|nr:hypothetical protein [Corynebacterium silvaticum]NON70977.1 hypothetical protein [Corynebacterium silvaticum]